MRVCLLGLGAIGGLHLEVYNNYSPEIKVSAVDNNPKKKDQYRSKFTSFYSSLDEALNEDYDLFDICLPTPLHLEALTTILAKTRTPILCEKPVVSRLSDLVNLIEKFPDFGDRVKAAFVERFNEPYIKAKQWTKQNHPPYNITLERRTKKPHASSWLCDKSKDGDVILDLGIHDIDALLWWTGSTIRRVLEHTTSLWKERIVFEMIDNSKVTLISAWDIDENSKNNFVNYFKIQSGENSIGYDSMEGVITTNGLETSIKHPFPTAYYDEINAMLALDNTNKTFPSTDELCKVMYMVETLRRNNSER